MPPAVLPRSDSRRVDHHLFGSIVVALQILAVVVAFGATTPTVKLYTPAQCDVKSACYPWQIQAGPFCARGNKMPLRFFLDIAEEDNTKAWNETVCGINTGPNSSHYGLYAFCPVIDQLQAFNLSNSTAIMATYLDETTGLRSLTIANKPGYLRVFGLGDTNNIEFPQRGTSGGAAQVVARCPTSDILASSGEGNSIAVVPFLILNISMNKGRFQYYSDYAQPGGVGFNPTCTTTKGIDICLFDPSMTCIGEDGNKNCAVCYKESQVDEMLEKVRAIQVWTSYYGTDRTGRNFKSGSNNPLNFRAYAGGSLYTSLSSSLDRVRSGNFNEDPGDIPDGGVSAL